METKNRRIRMTKRRLKDALLNLLKEKDIFKISVKELCDEADINRTTFYAHYSSPEDVLYEREKDSIKGLRAYLDKRTPTPSSKEYLTKFFMRIKKDKDTFKIRIKQSGKNLFFDELKKAFLKTTVISLNETEEPEYFKDFLISGNIAIIRKWLSHDCDLSEEKLASLRYDINHRVVS